MTDEGDLVGDLVGNDNDWHHMSVVMEGSEIQGLVFDGVTVFGTDQFLEGRGDVGEEPFDAL